MTKEDKMNRAKGYIYGVNQIIFQPFRTIASIARKYLDDKKTATERQAMIENREGHYEIEAVEIETVNRCNGVCPFCPVNVNEPQREYAKMSTELFYKIIDELVELDYYGKISIYSNNEPFLDERIVDFYEYAYKKLPDAFFNLYTNGTLLTYDKFLRIVNYVDYFVIDNYNDQKEINTEELAKIYEYLQQHTELQNRVHFSFRMQNEVLTSRGGQAPNKKNIRKKVVKEIYFMPYRQFVIRPTGKVSLCCNDALGKYTMGDVSTNSIAEIWESPKYKSIRQEMLTNGRKNLMLCQACDTRTGQMLEWINSPKYKNAKQKRIK